MLRVVWLFFLVVNTPGLASRQFLRVLPTDKHVPLGESSLLRCEVSNQAGLVQWTKDGLVLGFHRDIPNFDRYRMEGNGTAGVHNLAIVNATLEDQAEYQCQVGPSEEHPAIVAKAKLTVLWPATNIEIEGYANDSKASVELPNSLTLKCIVKGGKPAPEIRWYRNEIQLAESTASTYTSDDSDGSQTSTSTLRLYPLPHDNGARYDCEAQRLVIEGDPRIYFKTLRSTVKLDVKFAPGRPVIEGYRPGETVRLGDTMSLRCVSRGGNPLAQLTWWKNGVIVDQSYFSNDWESVNELHHVAQSSDNGAVYKCTATSTLLREIYEVSVSFTVLYAPAVVTLDCPKQAKAGDILNITCTTAKSNPASEVSWVVDGRPIISPNVVTLNSNGGWITTAQIIINVTQQERNMKLVSCYAINQALGETVVGAAIISILYAPDPPAIFGYNEGTPIKAGSLQRLTCVSHGGNPLPTAKWFKEDKEVTEVQTITSGNVISSEITIVAADSDNGVRYRCETFSEAVELPLVANITLTVYFPPKRVTIKRKPKRPKVGQKVSLMCESSSSHPAAAITWWHRGLQLTGTPMTVSESSYGGFSSKSTLFVNASDEDDGTSFTCKASNEAVQQSVHDAMVILVLYKPVFLREDPVIVDVKLDGSLQVELLAKGNPDNITYEWFKQGVSLTEGPVLNLTAVKYEDAGKYICRATNDIDSTDITLIVKVLYPAKIVVKLSSDGQVLPEYVNTEVGSDPRLNCTAEGYPLAEDVVKWRRASFNMEKRTKVSSYLLHQPVVVNIENRLSELTVFNVSHEDTGDFECFVEDKMDGFSSRKVTLLTIRPPTILDVNKNAIVKSNRKVDADLLCVAEGVPQVNFEWLAEGVSVAGNHRMKQSVERLDALKWSSKLTITDVQKTDFKEYKCVARTKQDFETAKVTLEADSEPDPPSTIKVINRTLSSLQISWVPGFDGGHNQSYQVKYKDINAPFIKYIDVHPPYFVTSTWLEHLHSNTTYIIAIMAVNTVGSSPYSMETVKGTTLAKPDIKEDKDAEREQRLLYETLIRSVISGVAVVFLFLIILNIIFMYSYYKKQQDKKQKKVKRYIGQTRSSDESSSEVSERSSKSDSPTEEEWTLSEFSDPSSQTNSTTISYRTSSLNEQSSEFESNSLTAETVEDFPKPYQGYIPKMGSFV